MRFPSSFLFSAIFAVAVVTGNSELTADTVARTHLFDVNGDQFTTTSKLSHATISPVERSTLQQLELAAGQDWPALVLKADTAWNWSQAEAMTLEVTNLCDCAAVLILRADDDDDATGDTHSYTGRAQIAPKQHTTLLFPLSSENTGMLAQRSGPQSGTADLTVVGQVHGTINLHHVVALHISGVRAASPVRLLISDARLTLDGNWRERYGRIADEYGQNADAYWPEKVTSDFDLQHRLTSVNELLTHQLRVAPQPPDQYGGLPTPTGLHKTGFFHTEQTGGRWWLVTPEGRAFFSIGVDAVTASGRTSVAGREFMFSNLPVSSDRLAQFYGPGDHHEWFDIYQANLRRGLGSEWRARWPAQTVARLKAWGFNTLGNWSDTDLEATQSIPYVQNIVITGAYAAVLIAAGRTLPDPFDPRFSIAANTAAREAVNPLLNDPWLIGYFSGNELPWPDDKRLVDRLGARVLMQGADSPAKQAFIGLLRSVYTETANLSLAWNINAPSSWADVLRLPLLLPGPTTPRLVADLSRFEASYAENYYRIIAAALHRHDPNHLYLGTRFAHWSPEVVRACARWCDVLSFNIYSRSPETTGAAPLWHELNKPVLVGEFHFGSLDRGSFWPGLLDAGSEAGRATAYAAYLTDAAADPNIVGAHWFKYADEPLTGRLGDGENGHIGLVGITDVPFASFTASITETNRAILGRLGSPSSHQTNR